MRIGDPRVRRALTQLGLFILLFYGLLFLRHASEKDAGGDAPLSGPELVVSVLVSGLIALAVIAVFIRKDESKLATLRLQRTPFGLAIAYGVAATFLAYGANIAVSITYFLVSRTDMDQAATEKAGWLATFSEIPAWWILPLAAFVGFYEEVLFRGFVQSRMETSLSGWNTSTRAREIVAVLLAALMFGLGHAYQGGLGILQTFVVGAVLGGVTAYTRSLWPAMIAHFTIDAFGLFALKVLKPMLEKLTTQPPPL